MKTNEGTPSPNEVKDRESALKVLITGTSTKLSQNYQSPQNITGKFFINTCSLLIDGRRQLQL